MSERPHLLLIMTDHWRGDCLGRLGHPVAETPRLDDLASDGTTFRHAYTPSPSCTPARRCLMTGMTPNSTGMLGYRDYIPWEYPHTLAGELRSAGYQTINVGKTHFFPQRAHLGFEQLITPQDYHAWIEAKTGLKGAGVAHGVDNNSWLARPHILPEADMEETWLVSEAIRTLERRDPTRPLFLCLSFNGPHPPWCPPQVYFDQFINRVMPPPVVGEWAQHHDVKAERPLKVNTWRGAIPDHLNQRARAAYFATLAYIDAQIGRLNDWMSRAGLMENTCVVFTSDHGEMLGDHNLWRKTYAYEASARIPIILRPPQRMPAQRNQEVDAVVGLEDIMPTFLDLAGAPIPDTVEGRSLLPFLRGSPEASRDYYHHEHAPCYHPNNCYQCITDGLWKYIWNPVTGTEQLFHLAADPEECHDLAQATAHASVCRRWRARLAEHLRDRPEGWSDGNTLTPGPYPVWRDDAVQSCTEVV
ncbi:MAG: arylsulfatase [Verrucomicrobia bacterium]|nr:arylsulfatase [Verrucomicrobiota bacterium]